METLAALGADIPGWAEGGVVALVVFLIFREIVRPLIAWRRDSGKAEGDPLSTTGTGETTMSQDQRDVMLMASRLAAVHAALPELQQRIHELHDWHDHEDAPGRKIWWTNGLVEAIKRCEQKLDAVLENCRMHGRD